jgi:gluconokinase
VLAAALDRPLHLMPDAGSAFGAALLGWRALGHLPSLEHAAVLTTPSRVVEPDPGAAAVLAANRARVERAYHLVRDFRTG